MKRKLELNEEIFNKRIKLDNEAKEFRQKNTETTFNDLFNYKVMPMIKEGNLHGIFKYTFKITTDFIYLYQLFSKEGIFLDAFNDFVYFSIELVHDNTIGLDKEEDLV